MPTFSSKLQFFLDRDVVSGSSYNITTSEAIIACNHSTTLTLTLPASSLVNEGRVYVIKDESGTAATNNIIIQTSGSDTIDGETSLTIAGNYNSVCIYRGQSGKWHVY